MTNIKDYLFDEMNIATLLDEQEIDWPVVYQIYSNSSIYVGETTSLRNRMIQHINSKDKSSLVRFSAVFDETFNKSAALDLESKLIQWFGGDGRYTVMNRNEGIADKNYYNRDSYQQRFNSIWEMLREKGIAENSVADIENSELFKFSPYKALNSEQQRIVHEVAVELISSVGGGRGSMSVISGSEGTGKTIVLMYLIKLIRDVQDFIEDEQGDQDDTTSQWYGELVNSTSSAALKDKEIAFIVPNPSLKASISKVFKMINNMKSVDILTALEIGSSEKFYDITFIDEAHLLKFGNQEVHKKNREKVSLINKRLFGSDGIYTQLDWIAKKSQNLVLVYDDQRVRPNNITESDLVKYKAKKHTLRSQMRSRGGHLYIDYLKAILSNDPPSEKQTFEAFDFKLYVDFKKFINDTRQKDSELGLSRVVAGFAWPWVSKRDKSAYDIEIDDVSLRWNSTTLDWVGSTASLDEVGSIYTIQGYDLNYCGVIIGKDLKYDKDSRRIVFDKTNYHDLNAKKRNARQLESDEVMSDEELLEQVRRVYRILMNRSIRGTYVYVCDDGLREYLAQYIDVVS